MMKRAIRLRLSCLLLFCATAGERRTQSQALPTATGPASSLQVGLGMSGYHIDYGQRWLGGPLVWLGYKPLMHLGVEGELRSLRYNQDLGVHASTYLLGPRFTLHRRFCDPYVKVMAGSGRLTFPYSYAHGAYFVVAAGSGVDVRVGERLQLRIIDVTYQQWPRFSFGNMTSFGASAGISVTLHRGETWRSEGH